MSMQYRFFCVPVTNADGVETEMNDFLRTVQVITVHRDLISQENRYYWAIAVEYVTGRERDTRKGDQGKKKIDYKEVLAPQEFSVFAKLRDWRKETATREGVPLYTIFMNEQLAAMVQNKVSNKAGLREIEGVGDARVDKYGDAVLKILQSEPQPGQGQDNATGQPSV
jgi:superfamily II DNA helicase RecQ